MITLLFVTFGVAIVFFVFGTWHRYYNIENVAVALGLVALVVVAAFVLVQFVPSVKLDRRLLGLVLAVATMMIFGTGVSFGEWLQDAVKRRRTLAYIKECEEFGEARYRA